VSANPPSCPCHVTADKELRLLRLGLGDKLQLACTEKKGRAQAIQVHGASVMLPTGEPFNCHAAY